MQICSSGQMCRIHRTLLPPCPRHRLYCRCTTRALVPCHQLNLAARLDRLDRDRPEDRLETHPVDRLDPWALDRLVRWGLCHRLDRRVPLETNRTVLVVPCPR